MSTIYQTPQIKPVLNEAFADNGEHSHWELIDGNNGKILWSEQLATDGREQEKENVLGRVLEQAERIQKLQSSLTEKEKMVNELEKVLTGLVNLKELKDTEGKTEIYLQLQPIAWKQAKELLNK